MNIYVRTLAVTLILTCGTVLHGSEEPTTPDQKGLSSLGQQISHLSKFKRDGLVFNKMYTKFMQNNDKDTDGGPALRIMIYLAGAYPPVLTYKFDDPYTKKNTYALMHLAQRLSLEEFTPSRLYNAFCSILKFDKSKAQRAETLIEIGINRLNIPVANAILMDAQTDITDRPDVLVAMTERCKFFCEVEGKLQHEKIRKHNSNTVSDITVFLLMRTPSAKGLMGKTPHSPDCVNCELIFNYASDALEAPTSTKESSETGTEEV